MLDTLTAFSGKNNGEWVLTCPLHGKVPYEFKSIGGTNRALLSLREHMDEKHPGVKARLKVTIIHTLNTTYTATTVIDTGDLL
jgi:hypothetical protein